MRASLRLCVVVGWLPSGALAQSPASPMWFDLERGPHGVGFTAQWVLDSSRTYGEHQARPIRILVWYPAVAGTGAPMRYGDYLGIEPWGDLVEYGAALAAADRRTATRQFDPPSDSLLAVIADLPVAARRDGRAGRGSFPLVIHSLGLGDYQLESTVLWEYLSSHGYVVAVVPQVGSAPERALAFDESSMETQDRDIGFVRRAMADHPWVDDGRVALVGHSFGGLAALIYAARAPDVDAVVSLDGSAMTESGVALANQVGWTFASARAQVLNLFRATAPPRDRALFDRLPQVDRYHVSLGDTVAPRRATHFDFQNWPLFGELVGVADPRGERWRSGPMGVAFYLAVCRLTRGFLDDVLGGGTSTTSALRGGTAATGLGEGMLQVWYDAADGGSLR